jgi:hypothetical protein
MSEGRLSKALPTAQTSVEQLGNWMAGQFEVEASHV